MARAVMAEFASPEALVAAIRELRSRGYTSLDAYTPYPIDEVVDALALKPSPIPWFVLAGAAVGGSVAYLVQWFLNAISYRLNVGGRPFHAAPAFVPITYELATLFAALAGFVAFFVLTRLPRPWHPVFEADGFESVSSDKLWLRAEGVLEPRDRAAGGDGDTSEDDVEEAFATLHALGALRVLVQEAT